MKTKQSRFLTLALVGVLTTALTLGVGLTGEKRALAAGKSNLASGLASEQGGEIPASGEKQFSRPEGELSIGTPPIVYFEQEARRMEQLKTAVLEKAGIPASDAEFTETEGDFENGVPVYEIEFTSGGEKYEYEIDAVTGKVIGEEREKLGSDGGGAQEFPENNIGLYRAKTVALERAGIPASDAEFTETERDFENGVPVYEIEFTSGGEKYEYEIDAVTGKVIGEEREKLGPDGGEAEDSEDDEEDGDEESID